MSRHAFRLCEGDDLRQTIIAYAKKYNLQAAIVATCVGSLSPAHLRFAGAQNSRLYEGMYEITSLVGTISASGCHLHITVGDENGLAYAGHLMDGSIVRTTAEIVLDEDEAHIFTREPDPSTGFDELVIHDR